VPLHELCTAIAAVLIQIPYNREKCRRLILRPHCITLDDAVERSVSVLVHLATLRCGSVELRPLPKLARAEIFGGPPDALLDVVPAEVK
jgi:hypothetical protein